MEPEINQKRRENTKDTDTSEKVHNYSKIYESSNEFIDSIVFIQIQIHSTVPITDIFTFISQLIIWWARFTV